MKTPHLLSAVAAIVLAVLAIVIGDAYAQSIEQQDVHALATQWWNIRPYGLTVNQAAMQQSDLLPVYGASELSLPHGPFAPITFFSTAPTGFQMFPIGGIAHELFNTIIDMAAQGSALRGKPLIISITSGDFIHDRANSRAVAHFYSPVFANEMIFNSPISFDLKAQIARLTLQYTGALTLTNDPVLNFALNHLAGTSPIDPLLYDASVPIGKLQTLLGRLQSDWAMLDKINRDPNLKRVVPPQPRSINWPQLVATAELTQAQKSSDNPFGVPNVYWNQNEHAIIKTENKFTDQSFAKALQSSQQWQYLALVLDVARQLGAKPLIVSMPFDGVYGDFRGASALTRSAFYDRLRAVAEAFHVPLIDFAGHEYDKLFFNDLQNHPSPIGQLYYDWVINAFYHQTLIQPDGTLLNPDRALFSNNQ